MDYCKARKFHCWWSVRDTFVVTIGILCFGFTIRRRHSKNPPRYCSYFFLSSMMDWIFLFCCWGWERRLCGNSVQIECSIWWELVCLYRHSCCMVYCKARKVHRYWFVSDTFVIMIGIVRDRSISRFFFCFLPGETELRYVPCWNGSHFCDRERRGRKGGQYEIWEAIKGRRGTASETKERRKEEEKEEEIFGCKDDDDGKGGGGIRDRGTGSPLPLRSSSFDSLQLATAIRPGCYRTPSLRSRHRSVAVLLFLRSHIHRILRYPHAWELPKHAYVQTTLRYHHVCTCVRDPSHLVSHLRILWGLIGPFSVADSSQRSFPLVFLRCKIWIWISISDTSKAGGISKLTRAICCRRMQLVSSFLGTGPRVWWQLNLTGCGAAMRCPWEGRNRRRQEDIQSVRIVLLSLVCVVLEFLWRKWIQQGTSISVSV